MQDYGKETFCLFCQLHFWNVSLEAWLSKQEEGLTRLNDRINTPRVGGLGLKLGFWERDCLLGSPNNES